jgi:phosphoserine phosphatase
MEQRVDSPSRATAAYRPDNEAPAFSAVVLDVDSGICEIDGIEWLARRRGESVARTVAALAAQAQAGFMSPRSAYAECLAAIRPSRDDLDALARAYVDAIAPGCADALARLGRAGVRIIVVSRGPRNAMYRLAYRLGIEPADIHAVDIRFDALGSYAGFEHRSLVTSVAEKRAIIDALEKDRPALIVGDAPGERAIKSFGDLGAIVLD